MSCQEIRESLVDLGWDPSVRLRAELLLEHLKQCPACREAAEDYDRLGAMLAAPIDDATPPQGWEAFERKLQSSIGSGQHRRVWTWRPVIGLAAALLLGLLGFELGQLAKDYKSVAGVRTDNMPVGPTLAPDQIAHDVRWFQHTAQYYEHKASWVLLSKDFQDVGTVPINLEHDDQVLLLGLTLVRGQDVASNADLLVIPGQKADLTLPLEDGQSLHYRIGTSASTPTVLTLVLDVMTPDGGRPLVGLQTNLKMESGQKLTAGRLMTASGEYQLKVAFAQADLPAIQ